MPLPGSRSRYVFALPQADGLVYLGLTDEPVDGPVPDDDPVPSDAEVAQLLETVNQVLDRAADPRGRRRRRTPGCGRWCCRRRPAPGPGDATADLSRKHLLQWDGPVLSVVGGKLTTYRAMAEETVDAVVARLGRGARALADRRGCRWSGRRRGRRWSGSTAPGAAGRAVRHRGAGGGGARAGAGGRRAGRRRWGSCGSPSGTRARGRVADLLDRRTRIGLVPADRARAVPVAEQVLAEES